MGGPARAAGRDGGPGRTAAGGRRAGGRGVDGPGPAGPALPALATGELVATVGGVEPAPAGPVTRPPRPTDRRARSAPPGWSAPPGRPLPAGPGGPGIGLAAPRRRGRRRRVTATPSIDATRDLGTVELGARRRHTAHRLGRPGGRPAGRPGRPGRAGHRRPAARSGRPDDHPGRRLRRGAPAVRQAHRQLPGGQAPPGRTPGCGSSSPGRPPTGPPTRWPGRCRTVRCTASMAKALASDAADLAARVALQVHGAIGYTWECDLHLFMKRAWALSAAWGDAATHRARVLAAALARPAADAGSPPTGGRSRRGRRFRPPRPCPIPARQRRRPVARWVRCRGLRTLLPGRAVPRRPLRRVVLHRRHLHRHLLPAELPGHHPQAGQRPLLPERRRRPAGRASGPACAAGPTPPPGRRSGTPGPTWWPGPCGCIADGVVDREGVRGLAARLGYGERQLHRLLVAEVGTGALALARAQRAQTARVLVETTDLPVAARGLRRRLRQRPPVQRHRSARSSPRPRPSCGRARRGPGRRPGPPGPAVRAAAAGHRPPPRPSPTVRRRRRPRLPGRSGGPRGRGGRRPAPTGAASGSPTARAWSTLSPTGTASCRPTLAAGRSARPDHGRQPLPPPARPRRRPGGRRRRPRRRSPAAAAGAERRPAAGCPARSTGGSWPSGR